MPVEHLPATAAGADVAAVLVRDGCAIIDRLVPSSFAPMYEASVQATARDEKLVMAVVDDTLRYGTNPGAEGFPTTFDPATVYSRRT